MSFFLISSLKKKHFDVIFNYFIGNICVYTYIS